MLMADLTYYVWSERLIGSIGDVRYNIRAVSGGGRGGKNPANSFESYNPHTAKIEKIGQRGGVIPPGYYQIEKPSKYAGKIKGKPISKLTPVFIEDSTGFIEEKDTPFGRDFTWEAFLIHGPGTLGSDGCIVIDLVHRKPLLESVETSGIVILRVTLDDPDGIIQSPILTARV